ncbi:MAG: hypothetical protein HYY63_00885, partial [Elusimicrobia bacterium]|nr:hypothetical protein [Elusimicrobiota bacterium]
MSAAPEGAKTPGMKRLEVNLKQARSVFGNSFREAFDSKLGQGLVLDGKTVLVRSSAGKMVALTAKDLPSSQASKMFGIFKENFTRSNVEIRFGVGKEGKSSVTRAKFDLAIQSNSDKSKIALLTQNSDDDTREPLKILQDKLTKLDLKDQEIQISLEYGQEDRSALIVSMNETTLEKSEDLKSWKESLEDQGIQTTSVGGVKRYTFAITKEGNVQSASLHARLEGSNREIRVSRDISIGGFLNENFKNGYLPQSVELAKDPSTGKNKVRGTVQFGALSSATQTVLTKGISGGGGLLKPANNALIGFEYDPAMGKTTFRLKVNLSQIRDNSIENLARNYFIIEDHTIHVLVDGKTGEVGLSGTVEDGQAQALFEDLTTLASQKGVVFKGMYLSMETLISSFPSLTPSFPRKRESRELDSRFRGNDGEKRNDGKTGESQKAILTFNGRELGDVSRLAKAVGLIQGNAAFQNSVAEIRAGENRSGDTGVLDVKFELSLESSEVQNSLMDLVKNRAGDPSLEDILIPLSILQNKIGSGDLKNVLLTLQFDSQGKGALVVSLKDDATLPQDWRESLTESGAERFIDSKGIARFTFKLNRDGSLQASNLRSDLVGSGQIITAASDVIVAGVKFVAQGEKVRVNEGTSPYGYLVFSHISQPNGKPISVAGNFSAQKIYSDMKLSGLTNSAPIHRLSLEGMAVNYADRAGQRGTIPYEVKVVVGLPPQNFWQSLWTTPKKLVVDTGQGDILIRREFSVGSVVSIGVDIPNGHVSKVSNNSGDEVAHFVAPAQNQTLLTVTNPVYNVVGKMVGAQSLIVWNKEKSGMKDAELFGVTFTLDTGIIGQVEKASSARLYDGQGRVIQNMMDILMGTLAAANSDLRIHVHSPSPQPQEGEGIKTMPQVQERLKMVALHSEDAPTSRIGSAEPSNITDGSLGGLIHVVGDKVYMDSRGNQPSEIYKGMGMDPSKVEINLDGRMVVELGTTDGKKIFGGEKVFQVNRLGELGKNVTVSVTQAQWTLVGDRIAITGGLFDGQRFGIELGGSGEKGEAPQNVQTVARVHSVKNNMAFVSGRVEMRDGQFLLNGGQLTLETGVEVVGLKAVGGEWTVKFGGPGGNISLVVSPDGQGYLEKKGENGTTTRITGRYVTGEHIGLLTSLKKNELGFEGQGFIGAINQVIYEKFDAKGTRTGKSSVLNVLSERDVFMGTFSGDSESPRLTTYNANGE